jgi:hypothetical protein
MSAKKAKANPWPEWLTVEDLFEIENSIRAGRKYAEECLFRYKREMGVERPLCKKLANSISADVKELEAAADFISELALEVRYGGGKETREEGAE